MRFKQIVCRLAVMVVSLIFIAACDNQKSGNAETLTAVLEDKITTEALVAHAKELERISLSNSLSRSADSPGYIQSMEYIRGSLGSSGLKIWDQRFEYRLFLETKDPVLAMTYPVQEIYTWGTDYQTSTYSGIGDVTAEIVFVTPSLPPGVEPGTSTDGCESADFQGIDLTGKIAVIQRGTCSFSEKVSNVESRGAVAVLLFNEGQEGRTGIVSVVLSVDSTVKIPVIGVTYDLGKALYDRYVSGAATTLRIAVIGMNTTTSTYNLFAETVAGRSDQVIMIGAHLDSVIEGPGINDNGSGAVALLEVARQIGLNGYTPQNKIRFAWWGAEEVGLIGSSHYLDNLSPTDLRNISMYLNVDCIASHNFTRGVQDTDLSDTIEYPGTLYTETPNGSGAIEQVLLDYFYFQKLPIKSIPLDGGSDYMVFVKYGIPFGGLFTELDGTKTEAEVLLFGGTAGEPYDNCYHKACDTVDNMNTQVFTENTQAVAHLAQYFGDRKVSTLFDKTTTARALSRAVNAKKDTPVKAYQDRYHKDRRDRATR
ncbi:MAG: M20/M25/M40 family metallo-hydrolase [Geobacteraceae bacterium]|nr:M20/M25/M40 family metallo-hydrolase [Geobacteraceae bacterium]